MSVLMLLQNMQPSTIADTSKYNICIFEHHMPQFQRGMERRLCTSCITFEKEIQTKTGHNLLAPSG